MIGIVTAGGGAFVGMWAWRALQRRRRKDPAEIERIRRLGVNACGRIVPGRVLELMEAFSDGPPGPVLLYQYEVAGVLYQAAQDVSALPVVADSAPFLPGQTTSVKYDPKQPTNSILACEDWCGVPDLARGGIPQNQTLDSSPKPPQKD